MRSAFKEEHIGAWAELGARERIGTFIIKERPPTVQKYLCPGSHLGSIVPSTRGAMVVNNRAEPILGLPLSFRALLGEEGGKIKARIRR
jgi:hypothetical protein